ncbi:MAG: PDZ domain-containing protein [Actinomycetota bacterium]
MWPDDEGEDEPVAGPVPDPSNRHWRHPSELGRQGLTAPTPVVVTDTAPSGWLWSAGAITGGLALVALGVLGLSLSDGSGSDGLTAGAAPTLATTAQTTVAQAGRADQPATSQAAQLYRADDAIAAADSVLADGPAPWTSTTVATIVPTTTTTQPADPPVQADAASLRPATGVRAPYGAGLYAGRDADRQLGSFVAVDGHLLSSATAVAGRQRVYLLVDQRWVPARVVATDASLDLAVLEVASEVWDLGLPSAPAALGEIVAGTEVFVGFCDDELAFGPPPGTSPADCGPITAVVEAADQPDRDGSAGDAETEPADPDSPEPDPAGPQSEEPAAETAGGDSASPGDDPVEDEYGPDERAQEDGAAPARDLDRSADGDDQPAGATDRAEGDDRADEDDRADDDADAGLAGGEDGDAMAAEDVPAVAPLSADHIRRAGKIWSTTERDTRVLTDHRLFDPIRTSVPEHDLMAGSALRDLAGRVVGLIIRTDSPNVTAVPIDRVLDSAASLAETGLPPIANLGLSGRGGDGGVTMDEVGADPSIEGLLLPGDIVLAVDERPVTGFDHLVHLLRMAEGPTVALDLRRDGDALTIELPIPPRP